MEEETTAIVDAGTDTGASESTHSEPQEQPKQSLSEIVKEETDRIDGNVSAEDGTKPEPKKAKGKVSASERVQQAVNEKNDAVKRAEDAEGKVTQMSEGMTKLNEELEEIKKRLSSGQISKEQAKTASTDARQTFQDAIDSLELSSDLEPFKDELIKISRKVAEGMVAPLLEKERFREQEAIERGQAEFIESLNHDYVELSKDFPALFEEAKDGQLPELKPEFDKQAIKAIASFNVPYYDGTGKQVFYNPITTSKIGLEILFTYLNSKIIKAENVRSKIENVERLKKSRVEYPESRAVSNTGKKSLLNIVEETIKEHGG
jgi:hypothetical protein